MRIAQIEAMRGLVDFGRIRNMLIASKATSCTRRCHTSLPSLLRFSLRQGRIPVKGQAIERLVANEAAQLMAEAGLKIDA